MATQFAPKFTTLANGEPAVAFLRPRASGAALTDLYGCRCSGEGGGAPAPFLLLSGEGKDLESNLSAEEKLRRERSRQLSVGVTSFDFLPGSDGAVLFPQGGSLMLHPWGGGSGATALAVDRAAAVGAGGAPILDPKPSPAGGLVAFVQDCEVYVARVGGGGGGEGAAAAAAAAAPVLPAVPVALTAGARGVPGRSHGTPDYINAEEFDRFTGHWWSPCGRFVAFQETDESGVPAFSILHPGSASPHEAETHRYPFAGAANARVRLGVVSVAAALAAAAAGAPPPPPTWMDLGDNADMYMVRCAWFPAGGEGSGGASLAVQLLNRAQTVLDLVRCDAATGKAVLLLREQQPARRWVNVHDMFTPLPTAGPAALAAWATAPHRLRHAYAATHGLFLWAHENSGFCSLELMAYPLAPGAPGAGGAGGERGARAAAAAAAAPQRYTGPPLAAVVEESLPVVPEGGRCASPAGAPPAPSGSATSPASSSSSTSSLSSAAAAAASASSAPASPALHFHPHSHLHPQGAPPLPLHGSPTPTTAPAAPATATQYHGAFRVSHLAGGDEGNFVEQVVHVGVLPGSEAAALPPHALGSAGRRLITPTSSRSATPVRSGGGGGLGSGTTPPPTPPGAHHPHSRHPPAVGAATGAATGTGSSPAGHPAPATPAAPLEPHPGAIGVWFTGCLDGPLERHLYCAPLWRADTADDGAAFYGPSSHGVRRFTSGPGMHSAVVASDARYFVDVLSSPYAPPSLALVGYNPDARFQAASPGAGGGGGGGRAPAATPAGAGAGGVLDAATGLAATPSPQLAQQLALQLAQQPSSGAFRRPGASPSASFSSAASGATASSPASPHAHAHALAHAPAHPHLPLPPPVDAADAPRYAPLLAALRTASAPLPALQARAAELGLSPAPLLHEAHSLAAGALVRLEGTGGYGTRLSLGAMALGMLHGALPEAAAAAHAHAHAHAALARALRGASASGGSGGSGGSGRDSGRDSGRASSSSRSGSPANTLTSLSATVGAAVDSISASIASGLERLESSLPAAPSLTMPTLSGMGQSIAAFSAAFSGIIETPPPPAAEAGSAGAGAGLTGQGKGGEQAAAAAGSEEEGGPLSPQRPMSLASFLATPSAGAGGSAADSSLAAPAPAPATPSASPRLLSALPAAAAPTLAPPAPPLLFTYRSSPTSPLLYGAAFLPDAARHGPGPYPTLVSVYGGPHVQRVKADWGTTLDPRAQALRGEGYLVLAGDGRGSARRGLAFEAALYGRLGGVEVEDQVALVRTAAAWGLADARRVGIYGWSYGGYMSLMCLAKAPQVFHAAVCGAPVTEWEGYDTGYTERYMGTPAGNPCGYAASSVLTHVPSITAVPLLIHGCIDENVHARHTMRLLSALTNAGVRYELLLFPEERHAPRGAAMKAFMEARIREYFAKSVRERS